MRSRQCKFGLFVMIKAPTFPVHGMMAGLALGSQIAVVNIIAAMTGTAIGANANVLKIAVAAFAGNRGMTPQHWEMSEIMIKADILIPAAAVVTLLTLGAQ